MPLIHKYLFFTLCLFLAVSGRAQYMRAGKFARMDQLEVKAGNRFNSVRPNESFGQKITIYNNSDQSARFRLDMRANKYFRMVYSTGQTINVPAHDSVTVGVKFLNVNARVNGIYTVFLDLTNLDDETDRKVFEFNVEVFDGSDKAIYIQALQENVYVEKKVRDFEVPVLFKNLLPDDANVRFEIQNGQHSPYRIPSEFQKGVRIPGKDTVINMHFLTPAQMDAISQVNNVLTVYMKNDRGDLLGMFTVYPRWLVSTADMNLPGANVLENGPYAQILYTNYNKDTRSTNVSIGMPKGTKDGLGFNMNYMRYDPSGYQMLTNTYLTYRRNNLYLQAGNIADFHELSLFGRGVKSQMFFSERTDRTRAEDANGEHVQSIEVWAVDEDYNLLSPFSMKSGSKALSARYNNYLDAKNGYAVSSSYFIRNSINSDGHLHYANWRSQLGTKHQLGLQLGGSSETFHHPGKDTSLLGYSLKADYAFTSKRVQAFFNGMRSSRNYSGVLQGTTLINATVNYNLANRFNLAALVQKSTTDKPTYTDSTVGGRYFYDFSSYGMQLSRSAGHVILFAKPYLLRQGQFYSATLSAVPMNEANSYRLQAGMSTNFRRLFITGFLDGGEMKAHFSTGLAANAPSFRFNLGMRGYGFSWVSQLQKGPYFMSDILYARTDLSKISVLNSMISYDRRFFNKLDFMTSVSYTRNSNFDGAQIYASQTLEYDLGKGFTALGHALYMHSGDRGNVQVSVGLRKRFDWGRGEEARVHLVAKVYYDRNYNGEKDPGEPWAEGVIFKFDGISLISGRDGYVSVKNIEKGWHTFSVYDREGNTQNLYDQKIELDKNERMEVGIPPQFELKGKVVEERAQYVQGKSQMEGIKISIRNDSHEYFVYTQHDGSFHLQVKPGRYKVSIEQLRKLGMANVEQEVYIDAEKGMTGDLELIWRNNERKVELKKLDKKQ